MKIALVPNISKPKVIPCTERLIEKFQSLNIKLSLLSNLKDKILSIGNIEYMTNLEEMIKESDMVCVVGGDGSIIYTSKYAAKFDKPLFGVNLGEIGFLTEVEPTELDVLDLLNKKKYTIEKRLMLDVTLHSPEKVKKFLTLNEIVLSNKKSPTEIMNLKVYNSKEFIGKYHSDGLIVATATGSTAYTLSAGGAVALPDCRSIIVTPICPHNFMNRSLIFSDISEITIKPEFVENKKDSGALMISDGSDMVSITSDSVIKVKKSQYFTKLIKFKNISFFEKLQSKLLINKYL